MWPQCAQTENPATLNRGARSAHSILVRRIEVSTVHIVTTPSLRFHLTLFVRTQLEEVELSFDFEAEDNYAAGDKVLAIADRLDACPGVLDWQILSIVRIRTAGPQ